MQEQASLLQKEEQEEEQDDETMAIAICAANWSSPVIDPAYFIDEISYQIGSWKFITNAPHT